MRLKTWYRDLERGEASLRVDLAFRLGGAGLLALTAFAAKLLRSMEAAAGKATNTPAETLVALGLIALLFSGLAFLIEGAGLFRLQPVPPRPWFPQRGNRT